MEIWREIWREFAGFFRTHEIKAQKLGGKFQSIFREKIHASIKIFRANFILQTCLRKNHGISFTVAYKMITYLIQKH